MSRIYWEEKFNLFILLREPSRQEWLIRCWKEDPGPFQVVEDRNTADLILQQTENLEAFELILNRNGEQNLGEIPDEYTVSQLTEEILARLRKKTDPQVQNRELLYQDLKLQPVPFPILNDQEENVPMGFFVTALEKENGSAGTKAPEHKICFEKLTCVYSPSGGSGKTTFSLAYTLERAATAPEKKILYWSIQEMEDWPLYFQNDGAYNLSDLLYCLLGGEPIQTEKILRLAAQCQDKGVYHIKPCNSFQDLCQLEETELLLLVSQLTSCFDEVVCDMNSLFDGLNSRLLSMAGKCYYLVSDLAAAKTKWEQFKLLLTRNNLWETYLERGILIFTCKKASEGKDIGKDFPGPVFTLPWSSRLYKEHHGLLQIRQDSDYYEDIRKVASAENG